MKTNPLLAMLVIAGALASSSAAMAQAAPPTPPNLGVAMLERIASILSARDEFVGKAVYNDNGEKIGSVDDIRLGVDRTDSYLIIGAGGFLGVERHEIAVLISSIREKDGKIVLPGGSRAAIRSMPSFHHATDIARRDRFIAQSEQVVDRADKEIQNLGRKSESAAGDSKRTVDGQIVELEVDQKDVKDRLAIMKASSTNWRAFEDDVNKATARLRKVVEKTNG